MVSVKVILRFYFIHVYCMTIIILLHFINPSWDLTNSGTIKHQLVTLSSERASGRKTFVKKKYTHTKKPAHLLKTIRPQTLLNANFNSVFK